MAFFLQAVKKKNKEQFSALDTPVHSYRALDDFDVDEEFYPPEQFPDMGPLERRCVMQISFSQTHSNFRLPVLHRLDECSKPCMAS